MENETKVPFIGEIQFLGLGDLYIHIYPEP